jgi:ribosomal protein S18 acetylase RimI-like enzyme
MIFKPLDVDANRDFMLAAHRETSRLTFGAEFSDTQIEREIDRERGGSIGAYLDGTLVGICDVEKRSLDGEDSGWAHFIYLTPELRGKGLGAELVDRAVEFCREQGLERLRLRVGKSNTGAQRFYERGGFVREPERDNADAYAFVRKI